MNNEIPGGAAGLVLTEIEIYHPLICSPPSAYNLSCERARAGTKMCLSATGQLATSQLLRASACTELGAGFGAAAADCFRGAPGSATAAAASAAEASGGAVEGRCLGSRGRSRRGWRMEDQFRCYVVRQVEKRKFPGGKVTADLGDGERGVGARGTKVKLETEERITPVDSADSVGS